jgi:hypothetical protein
MTPQTWIVAEAVVALAVATTLVFLFGGMVVRGATMLSRRYGATLGRVLPFLAGAGYVVGLAWVLFALHTALGGH